MSTDPGVLMPENKSRPVKGASGNGHGGRRPGAGRPPGRKDEKTLELEAAARKYAGDALKALLHVAQRGKNEGARVSAAIALLDRGYGRPRQAVEHTGEGGGPLQVSITRRIIRPDADA